MERGLRSQPKDPVVEECSTFQEDYIMSDAEFNYVIMDLLADETPGTIFSGGRRMSDD